MILFVVYEVFFILVQSNVKKDQKPLTVSYIYINEHLRSTEKIN